MFSTNRKNFLVHLTELSKVFVARKNCE